MEEQGPTWRGKQEAVRPGAGAAAADPDPLFQEGVVQVPPLLRLRHPGPAARDTTLQTQGGLALSTFAPCLASLVTTSHLQEVQEPRTNGVVAEEGEDGDHSPANGSVTGPMKPPPSKEGSNNNDMEALPQEQCV